ncbi:UPF0348 protein family [Fructilactobacillus florum 8D]|uniref:tRNA(Met) cytidine acetate ligase n=1 Tax=Fructilactobacillus florum 8D TaxID=1221538 RepID=W9EKE5_9LACO|nr:nucleotidyltransferase [Fructilactobacillus florum]EKK20688.1 UPF0348 protein family [Fructilactobacillus florum 2F]ETO40154.1 UPF0348 protein family [Fructilactobacillus florum 8D]
MTALTAVGIVTEYDPFHNGHAWQVRQARLQTNADVTVAVMSSNWMQRGEPAIFDKWTRARWALQAGVDLVIELPVGSAVQPASIFAEQAIQRLAALHCQFLAFGCEHPDWNFTRFSTWKLTTSSVQTTYNAPFAANFQKDLLQQHGLQLDEPNDTLGFWYAQAVGKLQQPLQLVPLPRLKSHHNDAAITGTIASGTAIRQSIYEGELQQASQAMPVTATALQSQPAISWNAFWPLLQYQLTQSSLAQLRRIYQMTEGLEQRLQQAALQAVSFQDFLNKAKTKRYTYARLQRLAVYTLLQVTDQILEHQPASIRILGMTAKGQAYLHQVHGQTNLPMITRVSKRALQHQLWLEWKAGLLTEQVTHLRQDLYRQPIRIDDTPSRSRP